MRLRTPALPALALVVALLTGCAGDGGRREAGAPVSADEAALLAGLLQRNLEEGGADFVVTAPYGPQAVLTLTGEVDFRTGTGRAQAVTSTDGADGLRTVFFTRDELWFGDVPGTAETAGDSAALYLRRPIDATDADGAGPPLIDVLVTIVVGLAAGADDETAAFLDGGYTWQGRRSIDGRPTDLFGLPGSRTVAVSSTDDVMVQFATPLPAGPGARSLEVTTTLAEHGPRALALPQEAQTVLVADHPELADALGH